MCGEGRVHPAAPLRESQPAPPSHWGRFTQTAALKASVAFFIDSLFLRDFSSLSTSQPPVIFFFALERAFVSQSAVARPDPPGSFRVERSKIYPGEHFLLAFSLASSLPLKAR